MHYDMVSVEPYTVTALLAETKDFTLLPTGYLEDRRPASNMDPYTVTALLAETTILWEPTLEAEAVAAKKLSINVWSTRKDEFQGK